MSISIRRILFPTDFSPSAQTAQNYAIAFAKTFGAELHLLHVVPEPVLPVRGSKFSWAVPDDVIPRLVHAAELELAVRTEASMLKSDSVVQTIKVGQPVSEIIQYANANKIDLIVIGTHGHTGLSHVLLGSVAEKVVRLATAPVLSVHPTTLPQTQGKKS